MSLQTWQETLVTAQVDGATLTAAAAATCIPAAAKITLPNNYFYIGRQILITATGRISCAVTTPGTARFDVRVGGTVAFDSQAINLNIVAKTTVGWWLEMLLTCRAIGSGSATTLMGQGTWQSEAVIGSPAVTAGGNGSVMLPYNAAPAVGTGFDNTLANTLDMFFTQTVATGSMTLHQYKVISLN
jgi:hypothetical protein